MAITEKPSNLHQIVSNPQKNLKNLRQKKLKNEGYSNFRFKEKTAQRLLKFSKTHFKTHTDAMAGTLDFFYFSEISPKKKLGPTEKLLKN